MDDAVVVEYGAPQRPATPAVQLVGMATERAAFARVGVTPEAEAVECGSAAPSNAAVPAVIANPERAGTTYPAPATSAETALSSVAHAATTTTSVGPMAAIPTT